MGQIPPPSAHLVADSPREEDHELRGLIALDLPMLDGVATRKLSNWVASIAHATCSSRDDFSPATVDREGVGQGIKSMHFTMLRTI